MLLVFDRMTVTSSTKREKTPEGFLLIRDNKLARTGVMEYKAREINIEDASPTFRDPMETVRVYRPPSLFTPAVLATFEGKPIADERIHIKGEPLNVINVKEEGKGHMQNIRVDGEYLVGDIMVTDMATITDIETGTKSHLSLGHASTFKGLPGVTPDGEPYDAIQTAMAGNHVALVRNGRCGPACRVSDSATGINRNEGTKMDLVSRQYRGVTYQMTPQGAEVLDKVAMELKDATAAQQTLVTDHASALETSNAALQSKIETLEGELAAAKSNVLTDEQIDQRAAERSDLLTKATKLVGDSADFKGMDNDTVRRQAVEKATGEDLEGKSADFIAGMFNTLAATAKGKNAYERLAALTADSAPKKFEDPVEKARQERAKKNSERLTKVNA